MRAVIAREHELLRAAPRALGNADYRSGEREFQTLHYFHLILKKNAFQGAQCPQNDDRSRSNKLAPAWMHSGARACCNA